MAGNNGTLICIMDLHSPLNIMYMSRPRSESGPVLNWSSPNQNSELVQPKSKF